MNIKILADAKQDMFDGANFYDTQAPNLGEYFFDSVMSDIESLNIFAGVHMRIYGYYRMLTKRFPYAIYYRYENNKVDIYAVLDCRSNPKKHYQRLQ